MPRATDDEGMVTAEAAVVVPSLLVVLALALTAIVVVGAQLQLVDAAREGARLAARGESTATVDRAALLLAPRGATVRLRNRRGLVEVETSAVVRPLHLLPGFTLHASALAEVEGP